MGGGEPLSHFSCSFPDSALPLDFLYFLRDRQTWQLVKLPEQERQQHLKISNRNTTSSLSKPTLRHSSTPSFITAKYQTPGYRADENENTRYTYHFSRVFVLVTYRTAVLLLDYIDSERKKKKQTAWENLHLNMQDLKECRKKLYGGLPNQNDVWCSWLSSTRFSEQIPLIPHFALIMTTWTGIALLLDRPLYQRAQNHVLAAPSSSTSGTPFLPPRFCLIHLTSYKARQNCDHKKLLWIPSESSSFLILSPSSPPSRLPTYTPCPSNSFVLFKPSSCLKLSINNQ